MIGRGFAAALAGCLAASLAAAPLPAPTAADVDDPAWNADERAIAATDRAFYLASVEGHGDAWARFAAETARISTGSGKQEIGARWNRIYDQPGFRLIWRPSSAHVYGDLGVTSGPFESHGLDAAGVDQVGTGTYVTVWRRQADGTWQFEWDGGTEDPPSHH